MSLCPGRTPRGQARSTLRWWGLQKPPRSPLGAGLALCTPRSQAWPCRTPRVALELPSVCAHIREMAMLEGGGRLGMSRRGQPTSGPEEPPCSLTARHPGAGGPLGWLPPYPAQEA